MKTIYCLLLLLCPYLGICQPIRVGDKVPDISFGQVLNNKTGTIKLSQLKGKLVLLDFWATWCSNCLKKFNLLESLQQKYTGRLQVILVSQQTGRDTKEKIAAFLAKHVNAAGKKFNLPAAYNDTVAGKYFPHTTLPYYVWIGPDGNCLAITNSEEVTEENISLAINGNKPNISGLSLMEDFDFSKPVFMDGNAGDGSGLLARSTLSHFIPGMAPIARYGRNEAGLTVQYKMINQTLLQIIKKGYDTDVRTDRIVFKLPDSLQQQLQPATLAAKRLHSYAYELWCPPLPYTDALKLVQQDIQRYFGLYAAWEKLPAPCYNLTVDTVLLKPYLSGAGKRINNLYEPENKYLQNGKLKNLADYLNYTMQRYVLLQTTFPATLNISLPNLPEADDAAMVAALATMGIILTPATATVPQFVIYQSPKPLL